MSQEKRRLQFDLRADAVDRLDELVELTGAASRAEVVRRALALFDDAVVARQNGMELVIRRADPTQEKVLRLV